jgi:hypothetical protein
MSPLEFMQRLAALVPRPRLHLIRFHGVLAPHAMLRAAIVPGAAGNPVSPQTNTRAARRRVQGGRGCSGAFSELILSILPAVWRRAKDYRRHRRAHRYCQDPHESGVAGTRAADAHRRGR